MRRTAILGAFVVVGALVVLEGLLDADHGTAAPGQPDVASEAVHDAA